MAQSRPSSSEDVDDAIRNPVAREDAHLQVRLEPGDLLGASGLERGADHGAHHGVGLGGGHRRLGAGRIGDGRDRDPIVVDGRSGEGGEAAASRVTALRVTARRGRWWCEHGGILGVSGWGRVVANDHLS